ncbi:hypothetical protein [Psychromonas arctica]|uniref:hypothetical protein n=1 Tax=Psychromonas arctica TaxID=168275 RepID=UPI00048B1369
MKQDTLFLGYLGESSPPSRAFCNTVGDIGIKPTFKPKGLKTLFKTSTLGLLLLFSISEIFLRETLTNSAYFSWLKLVQCLEMHKYKFYKKALGYY